MSEPPPMDRWTPEFTAFLAGLTFYEPDADGWCRGWKIARPDGTTYNEYAWPLVSARAGQAPVTVRAANPDPSNTGPCPAAPGDGLCLAHTVAAAQSGGLSFGRSVILAVRYHQSQVLGQGVDKVRVAACDVVDVADPLGLIRSGLAQGADLGDADLWGADLGDADLRGAYLGGAYLGGAYLGGADLGGADLRGADLGDADLGGAYLRGADLGDADLGGAYLRGADLGDADLRGADLGGANLVRADLRGANLLGANLVRSGIRGADLEGVNHDETTVWPEGFRP